MESNLREQRHFGNDESSPLATAVRGYSGGTSVRLLLVDDSPVDRDIVTRELKRDFPELAIIEAANETALEGALAEGSFDLVITDFRLFWGDGLDVIREIKRQSPEIPVIMFTGTGNEEVAVEAMKLGVHDYVLKDAARYERLRASVRSALDRREEAKRLALAEAKYAELFDTVPVGLFKCTPSGKILDANPAFVAMTGFAEKRDLLANDFTNLHPSSSDFCVWREKLERHGAVAFVETRFRRPDGEIRCVEIHAKALRDPVSKQIFYEGSVEDITVRKAAEAEKERLINDLKTALAEVKNLTGLLPICAACKKIRDNDGSWSMLETYIEDHSHAHFTHSFCPECARALYPEVFLDTPKF